MIVRMIRVRIAGPRTLLDRTLTLLQDLGVLHIDRPHLPDGPLPDRLVIRERHHIERCLTDVEIALEQLRLPVDAGAPSMSPRSIPHAVRRARHARTRADALGLATSALEDERSLLLRYREFFQVFEALVGRELTWPDGQAFYVILRAGTAAAVGELTRRLEDALGGEVELLHRELSSGESAVLILAS